MINMLKKTKCTCGVQELVYVVYCTSCKILVWLVVGEVGTWDLPCSGSLVGFSYVRPHGKGNGQ